MNRELNSRKREGKDFRREVVKWHGDIPIRNIGEKSISGVEGLDFVKKRSLSIWQGEKKKKEIYRMGGQNLQLHLPYAFNVLCKVRSENI